MKIEWTQDTYSKPGFIAKIGNVTLSVSPDRTKFGKPARGTKWRACVSIFDGKFTISRYGRDIYNELCDTKQDAMCLAEVVYNEARSAS